MAGLSVSRIVNVTAQLTTAGALGRSFGVAMIAGDSAVISGAERYRSYSSLSGVANDFGVVAPEYYAAALYFSQNPTPSLLYIGRWLYAATSGFNQGQLFTAAQQATLLTSLQAVSSGGFNVTIDGVAKTPTGLNFSAITNLNGAATVINGTLTGGTASWNGSQFVITSSTTGAGVQATGTISITGQPSNGDYFTLGGTTVTFVTSSPTGNQVVIGSSSTITMQNLLAFLQASSDTNLAKCTYTLSSLTITLLFNTVGTTGNSFGLVKSGSNLAVSAATLASGAIASTVTAVTSPGSGTDISTLLGLTASTLVTLVSGYASETPVQCASVLTGLTSAFYGLMFASTATITNAQNLAVSGFIEGLDITRLFGVTITNTSVLSSLVMNDLATLMKQSGYAQSFCQYSSSSAYAVASVFGRMATVDFTQSNSTLTLMFQQEPGITAETLTETQANTLQAKNCNVFANYVNDTSILQYGVVSNGDFIDEIQDIDWIQNAIQTAVYNVLYTAGTKIPQTNAGVNQETNAIQGVCDQAVANGMAAPGVWNGQPFGALNSGQYLKTGYYIFAQSVDLQSEADRAARISPPIQVAVKLAGAIQSVNISVFVNP